MPRTRVPRPPIHSSLASEPRYAELIERFVAELPKRLARLERQLSARDWPALARTAHQLKGAAGSHQFHELVPYAMRVEMLVARNGGVKELTTAVEELTAQCRRVTSSAKG